MGGNGVGLRDATRTQVVGVNLGKPGERRRAAMDCAVVGQLKLLVAIVGEEVVGGVGVDQAAQQV